MFNSVNLRLLDSRLLAMFAALASLLLSACGGYGSASLGSNGYGNSSSSSMSSSSTTSAGGQAFSVTLQPQQIYPMPTSTASATASLTINLTSGATSGSVTLIGVTATGVTINDAFAGNNSAAMLTLTQSVANANLWNIADGASLNSTQLADLSAGKLYVLVTSAANPQGELRGQILPTGVTVVWASLSGAQEVPAVTTTASGIAAVTVNTATNKAAVNVDTTGVSTATSAALYTGSSSTVGTLFVALVADNATPGHWLNESITLVAADVTNYNSSKWYVNVLTPSHPNGEIRGQFAQAAPTLTQLQNSIFGAVCSGCHSGVGSSLPGVQNLMTTANTYAALVNVASLEQPVLKRIKPGDPDNSYLVLKIEGDPSITGSKMPLGGQLTQAQIDQIRAWITAGALNN